MEFYEMKTKILHVITGTGTGGAEIMLRRLLNNFPRDRFQHCVISMVSIGPIGEILIKEGFDVKTLDMDQGKVSLLALPKLVKFARSFESDILLGWMYHGAFVATLLKLFISRKSQLVWNIRHSLEALQDEEPKTKKVISILAYLSKKPSSIIFNSDRSRLQHLKHGFNGAGSIVIGNGFEINKFTPDKQKYNRIRRELGIDANEVVVGHVARLHWAKGYETLIKVIAKLKHKVPNLVLVWAGRDVSWENHKLVNLIKNAGIESCVHLIGEKSDLADLYCCFDMYLLTSQTEGFPNVVGEAKLTGLPCVCTDVGDINEIIGDTDYVCGAADIDCLVLRCQQLIGYLQKQTDLQEFQTECRANIVNRYSIDSIVREYELAFSNTK